MSVDIVVSAYRESLDWLEALREKHPEVHVWVYDKSGQVRVLPPSHSWAPLPNVGMCDHSYLHHVAEHYDHLADWTVFSPDHPFDHLPPGVTMEGALEPGPNAKAPWVCRTRDWDAGTGRIRWEAMTERLDRKGVTWAEKWQSGRITPAELSFVEWSKRYVGFDPDKDYWPGYASGGVFAAPRAALTYLPREFYARLRDQLAGSVEPEECHYQERLWLCIVAGKARYISQTGEGAAAGAAE